jgi:hypothetical protein
MVFTFCVTCGIFQSQLKKFKNEYAKSNLRSKVSRPASSHKDYEPPNRKRKMVILGKVPRRTSKTWRGMVREKTPGESRASLKIKWDLIMKAKESLENFMHSEGVTQKDLCDLLNVPASRMSEWCSFKRNCTAIVILDMWTEAEAKSFVKKTAFRLPVRGEAISSLDAPNFRGVQMLVGSGIWGIVKLFYFKNRFDPQKPAQRATA